MSIKFYDEDMREWKYEWKYEWEVDENYNTDWEKENDWFDSDEYASLEKEREELLKEAWQ